MYNNDRLSPLPLNLKLSILSSRSGWYLNAPCGYSESRVRVTQPPRMVHGEHPEVLK